MDAKVYELLVKTANRLDELELFDEAEAIDKYLMSLAGEKEEDNDPLSKMVGLANALDCSGDEQLQKYASVLDEIMLTIGAPRGANHEFESKAEAELDKLREKYRAEGREEVYKERRKELDEQNGKEATTKALADQVKKYKPLEMPLSTRYCPDHPGGLLIRVGDHVYQCEMDKKMYNYQTGFTTNKGNVIPGGGVEHQIKDWGNRDLGHAMFDTRQTVMSRFASVKEDKTGNLTIQAQKIVFKDPLNEETKSEEPMIVRFMVLDGPPKTLRKQEFASLSDAVMAVEEYAADNGFSKVKYSSEDDGWSVRFTATTPGGRSGRNIAYGEYKFDFEKDDDPTVWKNLYERTGRDKYDDVEPSYEPFDSDANDANDLPPFTYGLHMLDGRKVLLVKSEMKLDEKQRAAIANKIKSSFGQAYEIVFEQDLDNNSVEDDVSYAVDVPPYVYGPAIINGRHVIKVQCMDPIK